MSRHAVVAAQALLHSCSGCEGGDGVLRALGARKNVCGGGAGAQLPLPLAVAVAVAVLKKVNFFDTNEPKEEAKNRS